MSYLERLEQGDAVVRPTLRPTREWADDTELLELIPDVGSRVYNLTWADHRYDTQRRSRLMKRRCLGCRSDFVINGWLCQHCRKSQQPLRAPAHRAARK